MIRAVSHGRTQVTVTALDPGMLMARQRFSVTVPNRGPVVESPIPDREVVLGTVTKVDLKAHFTDPDGDRLRFEASSSDSTIVMATTKASTLTVEAMNMGVATVEVTATDVEGVSASQDFVVTVLWSDRGFLKVLYRETGGDNWNNRTNWLTDRPIDEWFGVREVGEGERVINLGLAGNNLTGRIPPDIGNLAQAEILHLSWNSLTGPVPPTFANATRLRDLRLNDNRLEGPVPAELAGLENLEILLLFHNALTGEIPSRLGELDRLHWLQFERQRLFRAGSGGVRKSHESRPPGHVAESGHVGPASRQQAGPEPPQDADGLGHGSVHPQGLCLPPVAVANTQPENPDVRRRSSGLPDPGDSVAGKPGRAGREREGPPPGLSDRDQGQHGRHPGRYSPVLREGRRGSHGEDGGREGTDPDRGERGGSGQVAQRGDRR